MSGRKSSTSKSKPEKSSTCTCLSCKKDLDRGTKSIECDICKNWICLDCSNIRPNQYDILASLDGFSYTCYDCKLIKINLNSLNEKLDGIVSTIERKFTDRFDSFEMKLLNVIDQRIETKFLECEKRLKKMLDKEISKVTVKQNETDKQFSSWSSVVKSSFQADVDKLTSEVKAAKSESKEAITSQKQVIVSEAIEKMKNIHERRPNFVILNMPEPKLQDKHKNKENDLNSLEEICNICESPEIVENVTQFYRLGKKADDSSQSRPMLVKLKDESLKRKFFRNLAKLRESERFKNVRIYHDMSREEREADKVRVNEAKKMSEESKKFTYKVRGPPWARVTVKIVKE